MLEGEQVVAGREAQFGRDRERGRGVLARAIAQVFSTYEKGLNTTDRTKFVRGINSFQLLNDGKRWWVVSIYWDGERPDNPIPAKYLKGEAR